MSLAIRIVACTNLDDELVRHVFVDSCTEMCTVISRFKEEIEGRRNEIMGEKQERVVSVRVQSNHQRQVFSVKAPFVANMCGKLTHTASLHLHTPGVIAYIKKERNNFGTTDTVYTRACNFHTGSSRTSTLFRAATSSEAITNMISHVFILDNVLDILIHNIVYSARLGRPVAAKNNGIRSAIEKLGMGPVLICFPIEECMFVHCLMLNVQNADVLAGIGLEQMKGMKVRINICRTGVLNFFVGLPGGVNLSTQPEKHVVRVCEKLLQTILQAT